ncbi:MAG TPA: hypothetical protein VK753_12815 [Xanthomonadaceae bacterium]|nr:hypothetical protein [Xanthomonadaceae bacterium]
MKAADWLGWSASAVLLLTLGRQVYVQWRERSTQGVSAWLFVGQVTASAGFVAYSWLVGNLVFVCTNVAILLTAVIGQWIYHRNSANDNRAAGAAAGRSESR